MTSAAGRSIGFLFCARILSNLKTNEKREWSCGHSRRGGAKELNTFANCLLVGIGGMLGTICRYLVGLLPIKMQSGFPIITLAINLIGAFCIGLIVAFSEKSSGINPQLVLFLKVGICAGFTTFSTFSLEAMQLLQNGKFVVGLSYMVLSVALCVSAVVGAQAIAK